MSDSILAQAARRLRYDAKVGTPDFAFKMELSNLLEALDGDDPFAGAYAEGTAQEYVYLSDIVSSYNEGAIA